MTDSCPIDRQQGDVLLYQTPDDGDIIVEGGIVRMTGGLQTAVYTSLFGGDIRDDGRDDNPHTWWGNIGVTETAERYVSRTQNLLAGLPVTSGNLGRIEDAAAVDLAWLLDLGIASAVDVTATIPAVNTVQLDVTITAEGEESSFTFVENWYATRCELTRAETPDETFSGAQPAVYIDSTDRLYVSSGGAAYTRGVS